MERNMKRKMRIFDPLLILIILMTSINILPAQVKVLTLDDAIKIAIENNHDTKIALLNVHKADEAVSEAYGFAMPNIDLSASYSRYIDKMVMPFPDFQAMLTNATYDILFKENIIPRDNSKFLPVGYSLLSFSLYNNYQAQVTVSQILFNSAVITGIGSSKKYLNLARESLKATASKTVLNVKKAFYGVILTKKLLDITKESLNNAEDNLKNVKALNAQGLVSEYDALQAEVRVENLRPVELQMENTYKQTKDGLKIVLGIDARDTIDVEGDIAYKDEELPNQTETIAEAIDNNPDIKTLKLKQQVDEAFVDLERANYWPTVAAFGNYTRAGAADNFKFQNYTMSMVGLNFSINLFDGLRTSHKEQQAKITARQTEEQFMQLKDVIIMQIKTKIEDLERVKSNIEAQQRNVTLAEKAYQISQVRYKEGTGNQLEIQNSDMALRQAKVNMLQSEYDYMLAKFELEQYLGKLDEKYIKLN